MKTAYRILGTFICVIGVLLLGLGVAASANVAFAISAFAICCGVSFFTIGNGSEGERPGDNRQPRWSGEAAYIYGEVEVCGLGVKLPRLDEIEAGQELTLVPEPENEYDRDAVALYGQCGFIGYMRGDGLQRVANDFSKTGIAIQANITKLNREAQTLFIELKLPHTPT